MTKRIPEPIRVVHINQPSPEAIRRGMIYLLDLTERERGDELRAQVERERRERETGEAA